MMNHRLADGVEPDRVVTPTSDDEIADILRGKVASEWVLPVGGATAVTTGNAVDRVPTLMDLSGLSGILEYEPADLTVSVRAGTRWSELIAALGENGQTIPVDVPFSDSATVGGVVAAGWVGPRRLRDGTMKDLLIGASFVRGDGLMAKAGGMVVKNVSGFEIPRLLHGSYGSLAVITSVNLKVVPSHEAELTLRTGEMPLLDAIDSVLRLTREQPSIAAAVVDGDGAEGVIAIRLSGRRNPIRELADNIRASFNGPLLGESLDDVESATFWQRHGDGLATASDDRVTIEVGCGPADTSSIVRQIREQFDRDAGIGYSISPGTGSITLALAASTLSLAQWREFWQRSEIESKARFVVLDAPRAWRSGVQIWSVPESQRMLMTALKQQFDPQQRLNRGRLWDRAAEESVASSGRRL